MAKRKKIIIGIICLGFIWACSGEKAPNSQVIKAKTSENINVIRGITKDKSIPSNLREAAASRYRPPHCLRDMKLGSKMKVLIAKPGTKISTTPGGEARGGSLNLFSVYYVFEKQQLKGGLWYKIGTTYWDDSIIGWVSGKNAAYWPTQIGDRLVNPKDTGGVAPTIKIYRTFNDLKRATQGEKVKPIAVARSQDSDLSLMAWPILQQDKYEINGHTFTADRIATLGYLPDTVQVARKEKSPSAEALTNKVRKSILQLDVVFVIDTTLSMQPWINQAIASARTIASSLKKSRFQPDLKFGLVEYRDYKQSLYFYNTGGQGKPYRVYPLSSYSSFMARVGGLKAARTSTDGWAEAMLEGMNGAISRIRWRGKGLSEKLIILIGDASGKESPTTTNGMTHLFKVKDIVAKAKEKKIKIFSMLAQNNNTYDQAVQRRQYYELANNTGGMAFSVAEAEKLASGIINVVYKSVDTIQEREEQFRLLTMQGYSKELQKKAKLVKFVKILTDAGVDIGDITPGEPVFTTGWINISIGNIPIVDREYYTTKNEVSLLSSNLSNIARYLENPKFLQELRQKAALLREDSGLTEFLLDAHSMPFREWAKIRLLPHSETSIIEFKKEDTEKMDLESRRKFAREIDLRASNLTKQMTVLERWNDLGTGWVPEKYLP